LFDDIVAHTSQLGFVLQGDGSSNELRLRVRDVFGETFQLPVAWLNSNLWQEVSFPLDAGNQYWGGSGGTSGELDHPVRFDSLVVIDMDVSSAATVLIDHIWADDVLVADFECKKKMAYSAYSSLNAVDNFEDTTDWTVLDGSSEGAVLEQVNDPKHEGEYALMVSPTTTGTYTAFGKPRIKRLWHDNAQEFSLWVYAEIPGYVRLRVMDAFYETFQSGDIYVDESEWTLIKYTPQSADAHWGGIGGNTGVLDQPLSFNSIVIFKDTLQPELIIDELRVK
jgi:hypothetical protein